MMRGEYEKVFHRNGDARQRGVDLSCTPARIFDNPLKLDQASPMIMTTDTMVMMVNFTEVVIVLYF